MQVMQTVIDGSKKELTQRGLMDKLAMLGCNDRRIELGFYNEKTKKM